MKILKVFFKVYSTLLKAIVILSTCSLFCICVLQVFCRYFLSASLEWSDEFCRMCFFITVFFGGALCFAERKHITIDILLNLLPKKINRYLSLFIYTVCTVFCIFLFKSGYDYAMANANQLTTVMRVPSVFLYMMIPVSSVLMIISILRILYEDFFILYAPDKVMKVGGDNK